MKNLWRVSLAGLLVLSFSLVAGCTGNRYERSVGEFADDKALLRRVKGALAAQPVYKYSDVKVQTFRGVVQLSGFVAAEDQRDAATEIAQRVRGVERVENNILLAPLERDVVRDFIPGREVETTNGVSTSVGSAPSSTNTVTGSSRDERVILPEDR